MPKIVDKPAMQARILQAAATVFAKVGFHNSKMTEVAKQAGLAKGTLYLYFPSKDALITALVEGFFADTDATISDQPVPKTLDEFLKGIQALLEQSSAQKERMKLFAKIFWLALEDDRILVPVQKFRDRLVAQFTQHIIHLEKTKQIRAHSPKATAEILVAIIDGMLLHGIMFGTTGQATKALNGLLSAAFSPALQNAQPAT